MIVKRYESFYSGLYWFLEMNEILAGWIKTIGVHSGVIYIFVFINSFLTGKQKLLNNVD